MVRGGKHAEKTKQADQSGELPKLQFHPREHLSYFPLGSDYSPFALPQG
jgi:hypothetical protein